MIELSNIRITNGKDRDPFHVQVKHLLVRDGEVAVISGQSGSGKARFSRRPDSSPGLILRRRERAAP